MFLKTKNTAEKRIVIIHTDPATIRFQENKTTCFRIFQTIVVYIERVYVTSKFSEQINVKIHFPKKA